MSMESGDDGPNFGSQDPSHTTENQRPVNQFQAYYPTQTSQPTFSEKLSGISEHPLSKQVTDFVKHKNVIYAIAIGVLLVSAVVLIFMIPQDAQPIEGKWIKSDGQLLTFENDGEFSNQIYPGSTWSMDGQILSMYSTVQIIDEQTLVTKIIVQTVKVEFSDDEMAMWWLWESVTIDGLEENLEQGTCSLIIKESVADNTLEYALEAPNYQSIKPSSCQ